MALRSIGQDLAPRQHCVVPSSTHQFLDIGKAPDFSAIAAK